MIKIGNDTFRLKLAPRVFHKIETPRRAQIVFFPNNLRDTELHLGMEAKKSFSSECDFYPILNSVNNIVGSLYVVNRKKLNFSPLMFYVRETSELSNMEGEQVQGVGGTFVYCDEEKNVLVVPAEPIVTDLTVLE